MRSNNTWQNYKIKSIDYYLLVNINSPFSRMGFSWNNKIIKRSSHTWVSCFPSFSATTTVGGKSWISINKFKGLDSQLLLLLLGLPISNWCRDRDLWSCPKWCEILLVFSDGCCWAFMGRRNGGVFGASFWDGFLLIFASGFFVSCLISGYIDSCLISRYCEASSRHDYWLCTSTEKWWHERNSYLTRERKMSVVYC